MPIDPSIISNAFANASNNMPDVNALMQQRIQGAENIYQIETGRQEQAAQAEKEAAQQAAEAMLPAVASAFSDPSDAGLDAASSMLPPEVSQAFTPFLQRLKGIGDTRQRMAILRAELAKDDEGRYILGQLEPTANMRLQAETAAGSQSLAERRLALDIQKAAEGPDGSYTTVKGGDGKMYVMNTKTGEMRPATADDGTAIISENAAVEGLDPKTKVKFEQAYPKAASSLRTAVTGMDNTLVALEKLIDDPGLELISGTVGAYTPNINADAKRAQALFDQIKAGAGLAALVELKQASPAGGALGNVSNQEGNTLRDSRGAFLQAQEYEDLRRALIDYYGVLERSKANIVGAFDDTYSYRGENQANSVLQAAQEQFGNIEEQIKQKFPDTSAKPKIRRVR